MTQAGVLLCGHGSRDEAGVQEFHRLAHEVGRRLPGVPVELAFLEFARPVLREGLDALRARGVADVIAAPGMLFAAAHAKNDIPSVLNRYMAEHPGMRVRYGRELAVSAGMVQAAGDRVRSALEAAGGAVAPAETLLAFVGRGSSDPDANANVAKLMRLVWEGLGLGWGETVYSGVTFPLVEPGLERAARLGFRRIVVFPYFLCTGVLVRRIYEHTDRVAARFPEVEFVKAHYLDAHPLVVETVLDRIAEVDIGENLMNCQLCKYREQVLGFESERGLPQESHHHHVEGIGTGPAPSSHDHEHHDGHRHSHRRAYPHAAHPLGPVTLQGDD